MQHRILDLDRTKGQLAYYRACWTRERWWLRLTNGLFLLFSFLAILCVTFEILVQLRAELPHGPLARAIEPWFGNQNSYWSH